jgi:hypothetical protein
MTYIIVSGFCHANSNGNNYYEVTYWDHRFTVNLEDITCSCRFWQLSSLPCPHAISYIYYAGRCLEDFVARCYFVEEYNKIYAHYLQHVEGRAFWPVSNREKPLPPKYVRMPGRLKKERKRQDGEKKKPTRGRLSKKGTVIRCKVCKGTGHNRTTCSRRIGSRDQSGGASQLTRASGGASSHLEVVVVHHSHQVLLLLIHIEQVVVLHSVTPQVLKWINNLPCHHIAPQSIHD